ncbi:hypothetical protein L208DRAFT_1243319 [Tricholoma matsutake]|nr:hypothetical protein L208DRAFT_1243319 [Tricholoma matsutake 945]
MLPIVPSELEVPGGMLLYDVNRDGQFPYIFQVDSHPLVHDRDPLSPGHILIYIQDTLVEGLKALETFEASLEVPLGPDKSASNLGIFEIDHDNLVFIRDMHDLDPENNVLGGWISNWWVSNW